MYEGVGGTVGVGKQKREGKTSEIRGSIELCEGK